MRLSPSSDARAPHPFRRPLVNREYLQMICQSFEACLPRSGNAFGETSFNATALASQCTHQIFTRHLPGACEQVALLTRSIRALVTWEILQFISHVFANYLPWFGNVFAILSCNA